MVPKKQHAQTLYQAFWSMSRHSMIAAAATPFLTAKAKHAADQLLKPLGAEGTLEAVAPWADLVKRKKTAPDDKNTKEFLEDPRNIGDHPNATEYINGEWHYADMPLGCKAYDPKSYPKFVRDDDVVHILCTAIEVLQGKSDRFSSINALRLVVHLVGDVHQPLHVGCSFLTKTKPVKIVTDPTIIAADEKKFVSDRGGNALLLPLGSSGIALHSYWDSKLGGSNPLTAAAESVNASQEDIQNLVESVKTLQKKRADLVIPLDVSDIETEVNGWASESLRAAGKAYQNLKIDANNEKNKKTSFFVKWEGKAAYDKRCGPVVKEQMTAAVNNLANLLNAII
jgi:hypothetical protein